MGLGLVFVCNGEIPHLPKHGKLANGRYVFIGKDVTNDKDPLVPGRDCLLMKQTGELQKFTSWGFETYCVGRGLVTAVGIPNDLMISKNDIILT